MKGLITVRHILEAIFSLSLLVALTVQHESSLTSIHYDDLCNAGGGDVVEVESEADIPFSVIFKKTAIGGGFGIGRGKVPREDNNGPCVCFGIGVYEYHAAVDCSNTATSLKSARLFHVTSDGHSPTCIHLPPDAGAFKKLFIPGPKYLQQTSSKSDHMLSHFTKCQSKGKVLSRSKREDEAAAGGDETPAAAAAPAGSPPGAVTTKLNDQTDEDFINTGTEVGHPLMRNQMNLYIESVIAKLTGLGGESGGGEGSSGRKYPALKLLDYTKRIMQKTCSVVNPDFFDLALNSFINLQLETYHIKEPYIGYSAFKRIELAMTRCLARSKPHMFVHAKADSAEPISPGGREFCDDKLPTKASNQTVLFPGTEEEEIRNITIPPYASSSLGGDPNKIAEPLIETVWKMLVSAHSYCYMYFSDYFNDHHTYTVALLPLFTNAIQEIWLMGGKGYDLSGENKLYGGLLGDVRKIVGDVDLCVGASREGSPYPWFMNRPLLDKSNVWNRRRKREVHADDEIKGEDVGKDYDAVDSVAGHVLLEEYGFVHECKRNVDIQDICQNYK